MQLNDKSLKKLRLLINEETEKRSGRKLVAFFNDLGFHDSYGQGFPSRGDYTDDRLRKINGTPEIDKCIRKVFSPVNFIGRKSILDGHIGDFNQFLVFDGWQVVRRDTEITFERAGKVELHDNDVSVTADSFLEKEFEDISIADLGFDGTITQVIEGRVAEIKKSISAGAFLAVVVLAGSSLEGILLGVALKHPQNFNQAPSAPKDDQQKVRRFHEWTLAQLINTSHELGFLKEDVKKFSHALRDFRNYIHPYEQMSTGFEPDHHTARICFQVLKAAIAQLSRNRL